jgi:hypothetical protein
MLAAMPTADDNRITTQLRVESELWERVKANARRQRMSANAYACNALERAVNADEYPQGGSPADRINDGGG